MVDYHIYEFDMVMPDDYHRIELNAMYTDPLFGTKIIGHLSLDIFEEHTAITWVYVSIDYREFGVAQRLLEHAWNVTKDKGMKQMGLVVDKSSKQDELVKYYEKRHFEFYEVTESEGIAMWRTEK